MFCVGTGMVRSVGGGVGEGNRGDRSAMPVEPPDAPVSFRSGSGGRQDATLEEHVGGAEREAHEGDGVDLVRLLVLAVQDVVHNQTIFIDIDRVHGRTESQRLVDAAP